MVDDNNEILSLRSLLIGYTSGGKKNILLNPLSASARKGEIISVLGRNGVGKSTLLRTLSGLQVPLGGEVFYNNRDIKEYSRREFAQNVGYISTESIKVANMTVYDLVSLGRFPHTNWIGKISKNDNKIIMDCLEMTSMRVHSRKFISELSDGERQKAMIARILSQDADIMIMDEPAAFLDVSSRYEILHLMHLLSEKSDKTIIFTTHDLQMAVSQSDKIWLLLDGSLLEGAPEDLMIRGAFANLFESSLIKFNADDGTFVLSESERGHVFIEGGGNSRYWTEKAVNRAGYSVSEVRTLPFIKLPSEDSDDWQICKQNSVLNFDSIYELISYFKNEKIIPV
jgi:iron complex transport system ATP-binding protein